MSGAASAVQRFRDAGRIHGCSNCQGRKRRIEAHLGRFRERSRLAGAGAMARASYGNTGIRFKGGNLFVDRIDIPDDVQAGGVVDIVVKVSNGALGVLPTDPDRCPDQVQPAYEYEVQVQPSWGTQQDQRQCIGTTAVGTNDEFHEFSIPAPAEPGTFTVDVELFLPGSRQSGSLTHSIVVTETAPVRPPPGGGNGNGNGGDNGNGGLGNGPILPCFLDPNRSCGLPETIAWTGLGAVVLFAFLTG